MVTVYFSDHKCDVPVEIQLRTIAMEFWAALEHQLRYKKNRNRMEGLQKQLKQCAELITNVPEVPNIATGVEEHLQRNARNMGRPQI